MRQDRQVDWFFLIVAFAFLLTLIAISVIES